MRLNKGLVGGEDGAVPRRGAGRKGAGGQIERSSGEATHSGDDCSYRAGLRCFGRGM